MAEGPAADHVIGPHGTPPGVSWGQTARTGGASGAPYASWNLAAHVGDEAVSLRENWRRLARRTGWSRDGLATCRQVHGREIVTVERGGHHDVAADALVSATRGVAVGVFTADCVPVLLAAPTRGVVAAAHCGWRGAAAGLASRVIDRLVSEYGCEPTDLHVWLGASIAQRHYEVGGEVAARFGGSRTEPTGTRGKYLLDVAGAVADELLGAGVPRDRLERCALDTYGDAGSLFSYRRDGAATGRMLSYVGLPGDR